MLGMTRSYQKARCILRYTPGRLSVSMKLLLCFKGAIQQMKTFPGFVQMILSWTLIFMSFKRPLPLPEAVVIKIKYLFP